MNVGMDLCLLWKRSNDSCCVLACEYECRGVVSSEMPLAAGVSLAPPFDGPSEIVDPLNFVEVVIPVTFPGDLSLSLNCITVVSSSSSQSSPGGSSSSISFSPSVSVSTPRSSSSSSTCYSQNEGSGGLRSAFLPIDEGSTEDFGEEDLETILRGNESGSTSYRDDYTECGDLDLDFDEFEEEGSGQVTSTTSSLTTDLTLENDSDDDEEEEEEEALVENPNPVPCIHCQGLTFRNF